MYNLNFLNNTIVICPNNIKEEIFVQMNSSNILYNIKFLTIEQFYTSLTFNITNEIVYFVMKYYNITYDIAYTYLKSLKEIYLIDEEKNEKISFLLNIKKLLIDNNLINNQNIQELNILKYYNNYKFNVLGYFYIEKKYLKALSFINNKEINKPNCYNKRALCVYSFKTIEDEINYTFEQIIKLLKNNVNINNIKITGVSSDYYFLLKQFAKMYHLPITIENERSLYNTNVGKEFLSSIMNNTYVSYLETLKQINTNYYNIIISILNEFTFVSDYKEIITLLQKEFKHKYINEIYTNDIKVIPFSNLKNNSEDHIFLLGLNQGNIPVIVRDEDYLSDKIKESLQLSTTVEINKAKKEETYYKITTINNIYLSYSLSTSFNDLLPSSIIKEYGIQVKEAEELSYKYSHTFNKYYLTSKLDDYVKYNAQSDTLYKLSSNYNINYYNSYDNKFKGINKELLKEYLNNTVNLSYTSLNTYNKCKFAYYIEKILKLNIYEDTFYTNIGSLFHEILSKAFFENFHFEEEYQIAKNKYFNNCIAKEEFLLIKLKDELKYIIEIIKEQMQYINYNELLTEKEINININANCNIKFKGIIDKVMYKEVEGVAYVAVVDYKTGTIDPSLNDCIYGLNLQLPIYVYLSKELDFKEICVTGFYYQTILQNPKKSENDIEEENNKEQYLKLKGYTVDMPEQLCFDSTSNNSVIIKSLKKNKDGSYSQNAKILNLFEMEQLETIVEYYIIEAGNGIINGDFSIDPKVIGKNNKSCEFCKYSDLCFKTNNDLQYLIKRNDLSFLKGDEENVD